MQVQSDPVVAMKQHATNGKQAQSGQELTVVPYNSSTALRLEDVYETKGDSPIK